MSFSLSASTLIPLALRAGSLFGFVIGARAVEPNPGPVVELPTFTVTDSRLLPPPEPWRYAQIPGFEILSNASDAATQRLMKDFLRFHQAIGVVWPAIQMNSEVPASLILCANANKFSEFVPVDTHNGVSGSISLSLRDKEQAAIVVDLQTSVLAVSVPDNGDTPATGGSVDGMYADYTLQLHREYVHFLLQRIDPRPPAWLEEGLAQLFMGMTYSKDQIEFGKITDPNKVSVIQGVANQMNSTAGDGETTVTAPAEDEDFNAALKRKSLIPLGKVFAVTHTDPDALNTLGNLWPKECYAFVDLCLYGDHQKYLKSFVTFVDRSSREPVSETLFKECFGMSYKDMISVIRGYADFTVFKSVQFRTKKGQRFPEPDPLVLRAATEGEIGRMKGDALRMAGRDDAAHLNLIAPYIRGSRDPQLLAAIGVDEFAAGHDDRATKFLETAVANKTTRARAYVELGQLRLKAAQAVPAGGKGKLSALQMNSILTPLFAGRSRPPALAESYETIASAWLDSAATPTRSNLAVVDEGVRRFPSDGDLDYRSALLWATIGDTKAAVARCDIGTAWAFDDAAKQRFIDLKESLTAPPVQE